MVKDSYTREALPSKVLAEYLAYLSALFGESSYVHFKKLDEGSLVIVQRVDAPAVTRVRDRLKKAQRPHAPEEMQKPKKALDGVLARENAKATLYDGAGRKVIDFLGREAIQRIGPVEQEGQLDGMLIWVGGAGHPARAEFQSKDVVHKCTLDRDMARRLGPHLYGEPLRVFGHATWSRDPDSGWMLENFRIRSFIELREESLAESVAKLRAVKGSAWETDEDPIAELHRIRHGQD